MEMDFNGSHRVARSLTGYITDQSSPPGVSAGSQAVQERHNKACALSFSLTHTRVHTDTDTHTSRELFLINWKATNHTDFRIGSIIIAGLIAIFQKS